MNGATAEPCARMIRPPNTSSNSTIGASQYFLRTRMNAHSSARNDIPVPIVVAEFGRPELGRLELVLHRLRLRLIARDPITRQIGTAGERQHILAAQAHDPADRRDAEEEDRA